MDQVEERLLVLEGRVDALEKRLLSDMERPISRDRRQSPKEFLLTKSVGTETQKALALAYYLESQEGISPFNVPDLETVFRAAREKLPKNMNDVVNKNVARGLMMEAKEKKDSKKAWHVTATGERFVSEEMAR